MDYTEAEIAEFMEFLVYENLAEWRTDHGFVGEGDLTEAECEQLEKDLAKMDEIVAREEAYGRAERIATRGCD